MAPLLLGLLAAYTPELPQTVSTSLAASGSATITIAGGASTIAVYVDVPGSTTVSITCSADGTNYEACSLRSLTTDVFSSSFTADGTYLGSIAGMTKVRFTAAGGTGTGSVTGQLTREASTLEGIEHGLPDDFRFIVSGRHDDHYVQMNKFGRNPDIDTAAAEDAWNNGGDYSFSTSAETWYAMSTSASDTGAITCELLNGSYVGSTVSVTLTGTTPAAFSGTWLRVNRCYNDSAAELVGTVYVARSSSATGGTPTTASDIRARLDIGYDQTEQMVYTVPDGYELYWYDWGATISGGGNATVLLQVRDEGKAWRTRGTLQIASNTGFTREYGFPQVYEPHSDLRVRVTTSANNTVVAAFGDGMLEAP